MFPNSLSPIVTVDKAKATGTAAEYDSPKSRGMTRGAKVHTTAIKPKPRTKILHP
jgi:hypothetical protein